MLTFNLFYCATKTDYGEDMGCGVIQICVKFLALSFISHVALDKYSPLFLSFVHCEVDTTIIPNAHT